MLSEKLYALRRQKGLSQEELAERLGVSRQAVSKWESGSATPDVDRLLALSKFYGVTMDDLFKEDSSAPGGEGASSPSGGAPEGGKPALSGKRLGLIPGVILALIGAGLLLMRGITALFSPSAAEELAESSVVTLDGGGILTVLGLFSLFAGAVFFILPKKK